MNVDIECESLPPGLPRSGGWAQDAFKQFQCDLPEPEIDTLSKSSLPIDATGDSTKSYKAFTVPQAASPEHFLLYKLWVRGRGCREIGDSQRGVHATILANGKTQAGPVCATIKGCTMKLFLLATLTFSRKAQYITQHTQHDLNEMLSLRLQTSKLKTHAHTYQSACSGHFRSLYLESEDTVTPLS